MTTTDPRMLLQQSGCLHQGEFIFALKHPGSVSSQYINCDPILCNAPLLRILIKQMIQPFVDAGFDFVASPAVGAIPLCVGAAHIAHFEFGMDHVVHPFTEKNSCGEQQWDRAGFAQSVAGKRGIVLEDIVSSGGSVAGTCQQVRAAGGTIVGVSVLWNRGGITADMFDAPLHALITDPVEVYQSTDHPHWGEWPMVSDIGHPEQFPDYTGGWINLLS